MALTAGAWAATAAAETKEVTVPGEVVIQNKAKPTDPGNCSVITFVRWKDVPGTVSGTAYYRWRDEERSQAFRPPFDDTYTWVADYQVEPGYHWTQIGKSWSDGPFPNDCSEAAARTRTFYPTMEARVVLQVEVPAAETSACAAATKRAAAADRQVARLQSRLRSARTARAKARIRGQLQSARAKQRTAASGVRSACGRA